MIDNPPVAIRVALPLIFWISLSATTHCWAQPADGVAAMVDDTKILVSQVDWWYAKKFGKRQLEPQLVLELKARLLKQLVEQQVAVNYLQSVNQAASEDEVDLEIEQISQKLKSVDKSLNQFLTEDQQTLEGLRMNLRWQLSWQRYLDQYLTDENLEKYFKLHRRDYDGTKLRVAHLLIKIDKNATPAQIESAREQIEGIYQRIVDGNLDWSQAVQQYSQGGTVQRDGDLGWIGIEGPMPPRFTRAAFRLERGQISPIVKTNFGFHLIKCLDVRTGTANWYDVRGELKKGAIEFLFDRIQKQHAGQVSVRYTGASPYWDPESGQLVGTKD